MKKFMTLDQAKMEVKSLNEYIELVENYEVKTLEQWIIKNYALTNSIPGVIKNSLSDACQSKISSQISRNTISSVIKSKPQDQLHRIIRSAYLRKIRKSNKY